MSESESVFWPIDVHTSGYCYGWTRPVLCVAGVVQSDSLAGAEKLLNSIDENVLFLKYCGSDCEIIGRCQFQPNTRNRVLSFSSLDDTIGHTMHKYDMIYYHRHEVNSMRFYSFDILGVASSDDGQPKPSLYPSSDHFDFKPDRKRVGIDHIVLNQFNYAKELEDMIRHISIDRPRPRSRFRIDAFSLPFALSVISNWLTNLSWFVPALSSVLSPSQTLAKDIFAIVQQMVVRTEQVLFLLRQSRLLLHGRHQRTLASFSTQYVNFYNSVWLISNDIIVGTAFGAFLCENNNALAGVLSYAVEKILIKWIQHVLIWLDSWPAGLKLNTELSRFYSHTFIVLVEIWGRVLHESLSYLPSMLYIIGILSCLGMTTAISIFSDMLCLFTAHIHACYLISTTVYHQQLKTAGSLWNLFHGKRYNVLRNRTDTWDYDVDQLLFGTILFTLVAFLFPTVLAYYALFAVMRLLIILLYASMETLLAFMNHFPLFALVLRAKDPWRLPGGIYFLNYSTLSATGSCLIAKNQPVPLSSIFFQYIRLWSRLWSHYHPTQLLLRVFSGDYLEVIPPYCDITDSRRHETTRGIGKCP